MSIANGQSGKQRIQMFELEEGLRETEEKFLKQIGTDMYKLIHFTVEVKVYTWILQSIKRI